MLYFIGNVLLIIIIVATYKKITLPLRSYSDLSFICCVHLSMVIAWLGLRVHNYSPMWQQA